MKCPKCRVTMNDIKQPNGTYWRCPKCGMDVGKSTEIPPKEEIKEKEEEVNK